jgi:hemerythrin
MDIKWGDELKTGIAVIDEQHQFIVEALSGVETTKLNKEKLFQLLLDLQAYLSVHFDVEEDYMKETNYSGYESHKAIHDKVLEDYQNILAKDEKNLTTNEVALKLADYMQNWFVGHYSNEDVKMADHLKQNLWKIL